MKTPANLCPECGSILSRREAVEPRPSDTAAETQADWRCPNPDCPAQVRRWLVHWCAPGAMDIAGGEAALITPLVQRGAVRDAAELYQVAESDLLQVEGTNANAARSFLAALEASKSRDLWRLLLALDIPRVGAAEAQALARHFKDLEAVMGAPLVQLQSALGNGSEETTRSLVKWSKSSYHRKLVKRLRSAGLNFDSSR